jgi:hypothetical protein
MNIAVNSATESENTSYGARKVMSFKEHKKVYSDSSSDGIDDFQDDEDIAKYAYAA